MTEIALRPGFLARLAAWTGRLAAPARTPHRAGTARGFVSLVGAGPGSADLITLRGLDRLGQAEAVFYDRLVDPALLAHAPRSAERVYVGKAPGRPSWSQERINAFLVAAASAGKRVVRLKCGDPGIFARGAEEAAALDAAGIAWEIVPGVTAASAAAAAGGRFLTERGASHTLVITTGHSREGGALPDWATLLRPGVTVALYMAVEAAPRIAAALTGAGHDPELEITLAEDVGGAGERHVAATLGTLAAVIARDGVRNPAIITLRCPLHATVATSRAAAVPA